MELDLSCSSLLYPKVPDKGCEIVLNSQECVRENQTKYLYCFVLFLSCGKPVEACIEQKVGLPYP